MYLITSTRGGISAKQLERELGVTYKTAWRIFNLIRNQLMDTEFHRLSGAVEMDETYVGGKPRLKDKAAWAESDHKVAAGLKWAAAHKTGVFGMVERSREDQTGRIVTYIIPKAPLTAINAAIELHIEPSTVLYTDESPLYKLLPTRGWDHRTIRHYNTGSYVSGEVHTQQIEGFWSLVKRGISGTYHSVSPKWLHSYVAEYAWRYNHRDDGRSMFELLLLRSALPTQP
jgi:hypothetical protein